MNLNITKIVWETKITFFFKYFKYIFKIFNDFTFEIAKQGRDFK